MSFQTGCTIIQVNEQIFYIHILPGKSQKKIGVEDFGYGSVRSQETTIFFCPAFSIQNVELYWS